MTGLSVEQAMPGLVAYTRARVLEGMLPYHAACEAWDLFGLHGGDRASFVAEIEDMHAAPLTERNKTHDGSDGGPAVSSDAVPDSRAANSPIPGSAGSRLRSVNGIATAAGGRPGEGAPPAAEGDNDTWTT